MLLSFQIFNQEWRRVSPIQHKEQDASCGIGDKKSASSPILLESRFEFSKSREPVTGTNHFKKSQVRFVCMHTKLTYNWEMLEMPKTHISSKAIHYFELSRGIMYKEREMQKQHTTAHFCSQLFPLKNDAWIFFFATAR